MLWIVLLIAIALVLFVINRAFTEAVTIEEPIAIIKRAKTDNTITI